MKEQQREYERQLEKEQFEYQQEQQKLKSTEIQDFSNTQEGINFCKRELTETEEAKSSITSRKRVIDDTSKEDRMAELRRISPWVPQFTPSAPQSTLTEPPKRPSSPFSGQPLRSKDLVPVTLVSESAGSSSSDIKFICPVSRFVTSN